MLTLNFPTNSELALVVQDFKPDPAQFIGSQILPDAESMFQVVMWDERDTDRGMTQPHVMGADPKVDIRQGSKTRSYTPIPFKQTDLLKENEILRSRELGTMNQTLDLSAEVARIARNRFIKTQIRKEKLRWDTLQGAISISENDVSISETFAVQTYTPATPWSTPLTR